MKFIRSIFASTAFLMATTVAPGESMAEEKLSQADIQNELLRASLSKSAGAKTAEKSITESDLEKANKKLLAAEERLLEKVQGVAVSPKLPAASAEPNLDQAQPGRLVEKDIQPVQPAKPEKGEQASLDLNKVIAAIDRTKDESDKSITITGQQPVTPSAGTTIEELTAKNAELEKALAEARDRSNEILKELDDTRNRLMIAETQVERLSSIIDSGGRGGSNAVNSKTIDRNAARSYARSQPVPQRNGSAPAAGDMQIAVVTADKVHLRTGPGKENSPLMAVTKGTRLAVEMKNGEWYRVISPTGARAWVSEDVISFSTAMKLKSANQNQYMGFSGSADNDSFELSNR